MKINRWTLINFTGKDKWGSVQALCKCDCGVESITRWVDVLRHKSLQCRRCGYKYKRKNLPILDSPLKGKGNNFRHGYCGTPTYEAWTAMIGRCRETSGKNYKWYGSRGITVCQEWLKFDNFFQDMGEKPKGMYIDRINNDLGYFKENCRWVDSTINSRNRRCVKKRMKKV